MILIKRCKHQNTHVQRVANNGFDNEAAMWYTRMVCNNCGKVLKTY